MVKLKGRPNSEERAQVPPSSYLTLAELLQLVEGSLGADSVLAIQPRCPNELSHKSKVTQAAVWVRTDQEADQLVAAAQQGRLGHYVVLRGNAKHPVPCPGAQSSWSVERVRSKGGERRAPPGPPAASS